MHIIFGQDQARALQNKYTVLELDTFNFADSNVRVPAYCIIENVGILELPELERYKKLHAELIMNYRKQNWQFCSDAIEHLLGKWGGEMDSFYQDFSRRVEKFKIDPPGSDWNPDILKPAS